MNKLIKIFGACLFLASAVPVLPAGAMNNQPDSLYLFAYATDLNGNRDGLHFAWSVDGDTWHRIGNRYGFVKSDYGPWGAGGEKRMLDPVLERRPDGSWRCSWSVNERDGVLAHTESADLLLWKPQDYYPETDLRGPDRSKPRQIVAFPDGDRQSGCVLRVEREVIDRLIAHWQRQQYRRSLNAELMRDDPVRFAGLEKVAVRITARPDAAKPISPDLFGIFFEDINYAADGGLYAELLQNRDFEYDPSDKKGRDPQWTATHSWSVRGDGTDLRIATNEPLHPNNAHHAVLTVGRTGGALANAGWDGVAVRAGERYDFSMFGKQLGDRPMNFEVRVCDEAGRVIASQRVRIGGKSWKQVSAVLKPTATTSEGTLELRPLNEGEVAVDFVSLFPQQTFLGRKNGMRKDLAEKLVDLHPRFIRFPGGCVAHGDGLNNIYRWKNTIGPLWERKGMRNLWGYHQSLGLGFYEYFQFCEDLGAEPLPVVAAGVPCQNSSDGGAGQQGGIPMGEELDAYIQDILDLIEWANGDPTTEWGRVRARAGHPAQFGLKYIGIGNEDLISEVFTERYRAICKAVQAKYPEIRIIGNAGPAYEGSDYEWGWKLADELGLPLVDEHYYTSPGWFIHNQDFYDKYDRSKPKVYLGEYASHGPGKRHNIESALTTAIYLASVERNADVVQFASYAPLFSRIGHQQWSHNLIYFTNDSIRLTTDYYVQRMFGRNAGSEYIPAWVKSDNARPEVNVRIGHSIVRDAATGDVIIKLMNLLPVAVNAELDLRGLIDQPTAAKVEVLTGQPSDEQVEPQTATLQLAPQTGCYTMPPYSFTIIRPL